MSYNSNLDLARKYEWNAMMAESTGDQALAKRYEYMAKMATLDAAKSYSKPCDESTITCNYHRSLSKDIDFEEHPIASIVGLLLGATIMVVMIGTMI